MVACYVRKPPAWGAGRLKLPKSAAVSSRPAAPPGTSSRNGNPGRAARLRNRLPSSPRGAPGAPRHVNVAPPLGRRCSHLATPQGRPGSCSPGGAPGPAPGGCGAPQVTLMSGQASEGGDFCTFPDPVLAPRRQYKCRSGPGIAGSRQLAQALGAPAVTPLRTERPPVTHSPARLHSLSPTRHRHPPKLRGRPLRS